MGKNQQEQQPVEHTKGNTPKFQNAMDRISRRERRNPLRKEYKNDRTPKMSNKYTIGKWSSLPSFHPQRKKLKGWQREHLRRTA
jgi:hypothetical protein